MRYQKKKTKWERLSDQIEALSNGKSQGKGKYIYRNKTNATVLLSKVSMDNKKHIEPNETWVGDNYYMFMVGKEATVVQTIEEPTQEIVETKKEEKMNEEILSEDKLILDQPNRVTNEGLVEVVIVKPMNKSKKKATKSESTKPNESDEKLLTEDPLAGISILG